MNNLNVFSDSKITGGTYDNVRVFGSAEVTGDVTITNIDVYGSAKFDGNSEITNLKVFGACDFKGMTTVKLIDIKGSCTFLHDVKVDILKVYGSVKFKENISHAKEVNIYGDVSSTILEADKIIIKGYIECNEQLNGESIEISTNSGSKINEIVGSTITIKPSQPKFLHKSKPVQVKLIEGDHITLEDVHVETVRGTNIKIGPKCKIDHIEYKETLVVDEDSEVKDSVKI